MISYVEFECPVMAPGAWSSISRFATKDGWLVEHLGPMLWRISRAGDLEQNILPVPPFMVEGYAATYIEEPEVVPIAPTPAVRRGPRKVA